LAAVPLVVSRRAVLHTVVADTAWLLQVK